MVAPWPAWKNLIADDALYQAIAISLLLAVSTVVLMLLDSGADDDLGPATGALGEGAGSEFLCLRLLTIPALVIVVGLRNVYLWVTYFLGEPALTLTFVYVVLRPVVRISRDRRRPVCNRPEDAFGGGAFTWRGLG